MINPNTKDLACSEPIEKHALNTIDNTEQPSLNPKAFTTKRKHNHKTKPNYEYSIAKSMLFPIEQTLELEGLFKGEMTHLSFDCPTNLRNALVTEAKQNGTSVCKILTQYGANYVLTSRIKKHALGDTINRLSDMKISIGEVNFEQNVQSRPRRFVSRNPEAVVVDAELDNCCMIGSCSNEAKEVMIYQPKGKEAKEYQVCTLHFHDLLTTDRDGKFWRAKR